MHFCSWEQPYWIFKQGILHITPKTIWQTWHDPGLEAVTLVTGGTWWNQCALLLDNSVVVFAWNSGIPHFMGNLSCCWGIKKQKWILSAHAKKYWENCKCTINLITCVEEAVFSSCPCTEALYENTWNNWTDSCSESWTIPPIPPSTLKDIGGICGVVHIWLIFDSIPISFLFCSGPVMPVIGYRYL